MDQRTHSNLAITMKVYNHMDDKRMREERSLMQRGMVRKRFPVLHHSVHQNRLRFTPLLHHFTEKIMRK